jgi:alcohol dehydrogenase, propanol-preferring
MRAYRLIGPGEAAVVQVEDPRPSAGEVVLRVRAAGLCRTDLTLLRDSGSGVVELPVTLGHEIVGDVVHTGAGVRGHSPGATVAVYVLIGCGDCPACRRGDDNHCREVHPGAPGITRDGGMAEYVAVPERNLVDIGPLDPVQAAPLTDAGMTALHAVERGRPLLTPDATAVVIGVGGLGHLAVQFVAATSEARVIAIDRDRARLDFAGNLGAEHGVLSGEGAAEEILQANGARKVDVVFDFVGSQESLDLAAGIAGRGGGIVVTGGGGGRLCLTAAMGTRAVPEREVMMIHTFGGTRRDLVNALALAAAGRVHLRTETFQLEEAARAMAELEAGRVLGRAVLVPDGETSGEGSDVS